MKVNNYGRWLVAALLLGVILTWASARVYAADVLTGEALTRKAFVASLAGGWSGENNMTPLGSMPFTIFFEWEEDGRLHAHSSLNRETYIDLQFSEGENGDWMLREEAAMEGLGTQSYSLDPVASVVPVTDTPDNYRWSYLQREDFLIVELGIEGDVMSMNVRLKGEDHARFSLARMPDEYYYERGREYGVLGLPGAANDSAPLSAAGTSERLS